MSDKKSITMPDHVVLARDNDPMRFCGICEYYSKGKCGHNYIDEHFGPKVGVYWCCDFFERRDDAVVKVSKHGDLKIART